MDKNIQKHKKTDINGQNNYKQTETDINGQQGTETDRGGETEEDL